MQNRQDKSLPSGARLSPREKQCLYWISQGKTMEETAMILEIKYGTVVGYVRTLKQKLHCTTLAHLVFKAMQLGIHFS